MQLITDLTVVIGAAAVSASLEREGGGLRSSQGGETWGAVFTGGPRLGQRDGRCDSDTGCYSRREMRQQDGMLQQAGGAAGGGVAGGEGRVHPRPLHPEECCAALTPRYAPPPLLLFPLRWSPPLNFFAPFPAPPLPSQTLGVVFESIRQPVINGYLIAGALVGPGGLNIIKVG